jgi:hypothetical protein
MTPQKTLGGLVAAVILLACTGAVRADAHLSVGAVIGSHGGIGFWIGSAPRLHHDPPAHREIVIGRPWSHRVVRIERPCRPPVVIARPPVPVVVEPAPPVIVRPVPPAVGARHASPVLVWIVNSNGSKTSVRLVRHGDWYIGPRGEYYDEMPTNEQLRTVYGF